mgnify:CR=1 FL=1
MAGDRILIEGLCARCIIGVNSDERTERQDVVIDIDLYTDMSSPGRTDDIRDAVNYKEVKKKGARPCRVVPVLSHRGPG